MRLAALDARGRRDAPGWSQEQRTGALIRQAALPQGLDAERLNRVWGRLAQRPPSRAGNRSPVRLRWAFLAALLLSAGAVAAGPWTWPRTTMVRRVMAPSPAKVGAGPAAGPRPARLAQGSPSGDVAPAPRQDPVAPTVGEPPSSFLSSFPSPFPSPLAAKAPPPVESTAAVRAPAAPRPRRLPAEPAAPPRDTQLAEESQFVGRALVRLRQARDSEGALAELERYAQRFPSGILQHEALALRVDALLLAGRSGEAQETLSRLTLSSTARDRELRLIRAELATGRDCAAALDDYQIVWSAHPEGTWGERALWGQAVCAARLGDEARARIHLTRYLAQFPDGPHAEEARGRLRQ